MKKTNQLFIGIALSAACACAGCATRGTANAAAARPEATPHSNAPSAVDVFEVKANAAAGEQVIPAVIAVENSAVVLAQRDRIITQLDGQEGARVAKGEIIARLNDDDLRVQLRQSELEVNRSQVEEQQYEAMARVYRTEQEQEEALLKDGLSSKRQHDRAQYNLDGAVHELEKTRLATQAALAKVEAVKLEIEKAVIRSPITGVVTHCQTHLGAGVVKNDKLFEVAQLAQLEVKFQLPQAEQGRLGPGEQVSLSLAASDRVVAHARIRRLDPVADAASNTIGYLAEVIGGAGLLPGLAVNVHVAQAANAAAVRIPWRPFPAEPNCATARPARSSLLMASVAQSAPSRSKRWRASKSRSARDWRRATV